MTFSAIIPCLVAFLLVTPTPGIPAVLSPSGGQALQGSVPIVINPSLYGFKSAELTFSYTNNPTNTWFYIAEATQAASGGKIADWDTTTLTDGNYTLRLVITVQDGSQITTTVSGLRVRNYTPIETSTSTLPAPTATSAPGDTPVPTATRVPSPSPVPLTSTPLPLNPAEVSPHDLETSLAQGVLAALALIILFGSALVIRQRSRMKG
jgi:hypothetical protein